MVVAGTAGQLMHCRKRAGFSVTCDQPPRPRRARAGAHALGAGPSPEGCRARSGHAVRFASPDKLIMSPGYPPTPPPGRCARNLRRTRRGIAGLFTAHRPAKPFLPTPCPTAFVCRSSRAPSSLPCRLAALRPRRCISRNSLTRRPAPTRARSTLGRMPRARRRAGRC